MAPVQKKNEAGDSSGSMPPPPPPLGGDAASEPSASARADVVSVHALHEPTTCVEHAADYCIVANGTEVFCDGKPVEAGGRGGGSTASAMRKRKQLGQIMELVELPLRHTRLFKYIGVKPPRASSSTGLRVPWRTRRAPSSSCINRPEIMSKMAGEKRRARATC